MKNAFVKRKSDMQIAIVTKFHTQKIKKFTEMQKIFIGIDLHKKFL